MEIEFTVVQEQKLEFKPLQDYVATYHKGLTFQALRQACAKDKIDFFTLPKGKYKAYFVVMTEKTKMYTPNRSNRTLKNK